MPKTFLQTLTRGHRSTRAALLVAGSLGLFACAGMNNGPESNGPATDASGRPILPAGDIAIAGQEFSHSIMDLPEVSGAAVPPLVRFSGVTSVINGPVDTTPYTDLLRDRLLLLTREKLRFVERQLPPLTPHKKSKNEAAGAESGADYEVMAQLRGDFNSDNYQADIQFVDLRSGQALFDGLYNIRKEAQLTPSADAPTPNSPIESTAPSGPSTPINLSPSASPGGSSTFQ
jgi:hypothetical protein